MMIITDVVWNHTSYNTPWLKDHPEATYNLVNSPHLRPAFLIDRALYRLTIDVLSGKWQFWGLTDSVKSDRDLDIIATILRQCVLTEINLFEFFAIDVDKVIYICSLSFGYKSAIGKTYSYNLICDKLP